ncbi:hypothetical protein [Arthrobacter sp. StoSoilB22]|uniref:hypothetical protein n=1 Tax=Arthrobacter sp. StoSoilB22 TaxID=2830996 RepID=UPI001CC34AE5|nr:hypothetical protein [Arthrobacter sp. StoSoilB22]BCW62460.1 hypothetical protein StoSoilB22_14330 [Arthrobacter sp. StoSoilB22]
MSVPNPYHIHRQWHLGTFLDRLQAAGHLKWKWSYKNSRAGYTIQEGDQEPRLFDTKQAEKVAQRIANREQIVWIPVPHYGGEDNWMATITRMDGMKAGEIAKPWEAA